MSVTRLTVAALTALCLFVVGGQQVVLGEETAYTVVVKKVEVQTTKEDGSAWDIDNGKPDLAVIVRNMSNKDMKEFTTKTKDDTFAADFDETTTVKVKPGDKLQLEIIDKDVALNDTIGKVEKELTAEILKEGKIRFEKFHRVLYVEIEFKKP